MKIPVGEFGGGTRANGALLRAEIVSAALSGPVVLDFSDSFVTQGFIDEALGKLDPELLRSGRVRIVGAGDLAKSIIRFVLSSRAMDPAATERTPNHE